MVEQRELAAHIQIRLLLPREARVGQVLGRRGRAHRHVRGQSAALAAKAGAKRLWLVHYSPMITDPEEELAQAQSLFPAAECGYDGKSITLQYEEAEE
jgi:ribonuclease BN (tRNA processing enzyme)